MSQAAERRRKFIFDTIWFRKASPECPPLRDFDFNQRLRHVFSDKQVINVFFRCFDGVNFDDYIALR